MIFLKRLLIAMLGLLASTIVYAQAPIKDTSRHGKMITIISADRENFQQIDSLTQVLSLAGKAKVQQEKTIFEADSIALNQLTNILEAFGNVHINDNDSIHTYSQYLKYVGKEKKAYLNKKVKLTDGKGVLTTEELVYDEQTKIGIYYKGGKVVNGKTVLTSTEGYYYGETKDVYFKQNVFLKDSGFTVKTDTLLYNTKTGITTIVAPSTIVSGKQTIKTKDGYYDTKSKKAFFNQRPIIDDSAYTFIADKIAVDDKTGLSEYDGNAVYRTKDSTGYDLIAGNIKANRKTNALLATQKPLLLIKQPQDTTYITADTLFTSKLSELVKSRTVPVVRDSVKGKIPMTKNPKDSSADRYFEAYFNVRIFNDSLQAVCDSMFYSGEDSVFRLFKNPIAWAQKNQITGDTMYLFVQNKKPERLYVFENAMSIQKLTDKYFNQIKGTTINGFFLDGKIDHLRAKGNAETVYYGVDESNKYLGVNKASCDVIDMYFEQKKYGASPQKIVLRNNLEGTAYPMRQINHEELRLRKFKWLENLRPKSKFDIFSN
ncbi:OstA-like protein [Parasediminibacterium paludis]|uniref:OstA-like protein n=1 Tax=Parasediminibacterium paludis TaxID=908966 RepID=A0ABV8PZW8_9BACT